MDAATKLDSTACDTLVRFLSDRFDVPIPNLEITGRQSNRGRYWRGAEMIVLSRNAQLWVLAHEFAHHLECCHVTRRVAAREWHDNAFFNCLLGVIDAIGCAGTYPWKDEYKQLQRWNSKRLN